MFRIALSFAVVLVAASGCTMCSHPYDHSGPVYSHDGGCGARAGSILDGGYEESLPPTTNDVPATATSQANRKPTISKSARATTQRTTQREAFSYAMNDRAATKHLLGDAQEGDVPGSERIISVTERIVDSSSDMQAGTALAAQESPSERSQSLPTSGWTARSPSSNSFR